MPSKKPAKHWPNPFVKQRGAILVSSLPALFLGMAFLLITWKGVEYMHYKIATRARMDICAVNVIQERKNALRSLTNSNKILRTTVTAIYIARGLRVVTVLVAAAAPFLAMGEQALLQINRGAAMWQKVLLAKNTVLELRARICNKTPFSQEPGFCSFAPLSLKRESVYFSDLHGALIYKNNSATMLNVKCYVGLQSPTQIRLLGDPELRSENFREQYEK